VLGIPGVKKRGNKKPYDETVEVTVKNPQRKYHKTIERPKKAITDTASQHTATEYPKYHSAKWKM
jgi:hypothetical protein